MPFLSFLTLQSPSLHYSFYFYFSVLQPFPLHHSPLLITGPLYTISPIYIAEPPLNQSTLLYNTAPSLHYGACFTSQPPFASKSTCFTSQPPFKSQHLLYLNVLCPLHITDLHPLHQSPSPPFLEFQSPSPPLT